MKIEFKHVTKNYEDTGTKVLQDLSFVIEKGEFVIITGPSGIGKSTLIRLLLRETLPDKGRIIVDGDCLNDVPDQKIPFYRRKLGIVFQDFRLVETKSVFDNICLARDVVGGRKKDSRRVVSSICSFLKITDLFRRYPKELSGGEKQRVCLARALVNYPGLLLADEPTGNLSFEESKEIMKLLELINKQGITVIVATHDKESLQGISYREISLQEVEEI